MCKQRVLVNDTFEMMVDVDKNGEYGAAENIIFKGSRKTVEINDNWSINVDVHADGSCGIFGNVEYIGGSC